MTTSKDDSVRPVVAGLLPRRGRHGLAFSIFQAGNCWKILPRIYRRALARTGTLATCPTHRLGGAPITNVREWKRPLRKHVQRMPPFGSGGSTFFPTLTVPLVHPASRGMETRSPAWQAGGGPQ